MIRGTLGIDFTTTHAGLQFTLAPKGATIKLK